LVTHTSVYLGQRSCYKIRNQENHRVTSRKALSTRMSFLAWLGPYFIWLKARKNFTKIFKLKLLHVSNRLTLWKKNIPSYKYHVNFLLLRLFQRTLPCVRTCVTSYNMLLFYSGQSLARFPKPQAVESPLAICLQLLIQHICSYLPYLEAFSSIRNIRTCQGDKGPTSDGHIPIHTQIQEIHHMLFVLHKHDLIVTPTFLDF
jgi:hypothetical protein